MKFTKHPHYLMFVVVIIMPLNGWIMSESFYLGLGLSLLQIPNMAIALYDKRVLS